MILQFQILLVSILYRIYLSFFPELECIRGILTSNRFLFYIASVTKVIKHKHKRDCIVGPQQNTKRRLRNGVGSNPCPNYIIAKKTLKVIPTDAMSDDIKGNENVECLGPKYAQLITMHSQDFQTKVVEIKGLFVCYLEWLGSMKGMDSMHGPNSVISKDGKSCTYCYYI